jgi:hypothetical protein
VRTAALTFTSTPDCHPIEHAFACRSFFIISSSSSSPSSLSSLILFTLSPPLPCSNLFLTYTPSSSLLSDSQHPWHLYSRNLIIVSSTQAPFYRPNCIGFLILNSFVLPNLAFSILAHDPPFNLVSMPIEVTSSPSITDTLDSYSEYSYQPSLFAKISSTGSANNWIIQEQAIAMEDSAADVSSHRCLSTALYSFPALISCFWAKTHIISPLYLSHISAVITKSMLCTAIKPCLKGCPPSNPHPFSLVHPRWTKTRHPIIPCHRIRLFLQVCRIQS